VQSAAEASALILGAPEAPWDEDGAGQAEGEEPGPTQTQDQPGRSAGGASGDLAVPASLNCHLREYQREGVHFLYKLVWSNVTVSPVSTAISPAFEGNTAPLNMGKVISPKR